MPFSKKLRNSIWLQQLAPAGAAVPLNAQSRKDGVSQEHSGVNSKDSDPTGKAKHGKRENSGSRKD